MTTLSFLARLRELHEKAKRGALAPAEQPEYESARREIGRLLLIAQQLARGGQTLRSRFRVARMIKVEIELADGAPEKTTTVDLASGGFAALLPRGQPLGKAARFRMHLPSMAGGVTQPIEGAAKVVSSRAQGTLYRVSFAFTEVSASHQEQLETLILDEVLARFQTPV